LGVASPVEAIAAIPFDNRDCLTSFFGIFRNKLCLVCFTECPRAGVWRNGDCQTGASSPLKCVCYGPEKDIRIAARILF